MVRNRNTYYDFLTPITNQFVGAENGKRVGMEISTFLCTETTCRRLRNLLEEPAAPFSITLSQRKIVEWTLD